MNFLKSCDIKQVLYCKLSQFQKIPEITAGHLSLGLDQSPQSFLMFVTQQNLRKFEFLYLFLNEKKTEVLELFLL